MTPEHVSVTDLATRYNKTVDDYHKAWGKFVDEQREHHATAMDCAKKLERMGNDLAGTRQALIATGCNDLFCNEVKRDCHQCPAGNRKAEQTDKPFYGPSPLALAIPALKALARIAKQVGFNITDGTQPLQLVAAIEDQIAQIQMKASKAKPMREAFEDSERGRVEARKKIETLRGIVKYKAPHTPQCCPPAGKTCDCWKAEFMAAIEHMPENISIAPEACPHTHEAPTLVDCMRCGTESCHLRYGDANGQPYSAKGTIA